MKKRNWLKTTIAMLTLVATVLETGFTSVSTLAAEITTEDGIVVNNDAVEETDLNDGSGDELQIEVAPDNASDDEYVEETGSDDEDFAQEETFEEADELKEGTLDVSDGGISGSGYDEISIYVNTEGLKKKDTFRIEFNGPSSASYNPVINDELDKTNDGRYDFEELEGEDFSVRAYSSENVILSYRYNEDGYPEIVVESEETEKVLTTTTLTARDNSEIEAISGEGYESVTVKFNTEELTDKASFKFFVESVADAKVNGKDAKAGIEGLDKDTDSLTIEDLDEESFVAYVVSDKDDVKIKTVARVDSVEDGAAVITVDNDNVKRVYEYEDSKIKVTATLEKADAIPDDAYFDVTPLTEEEAEKYLAAANANLEEGQQAYTADNSLLYNIGFYTDETKKEEIEPEEGSVRINVEFKKAQLEEELDAGEETTVEVVHFQEEGKDIVPESVEANVSVEAEAADFELESFSVVLFKAVTEVNPGTKRTIDNILGTALYYGVSANTVELGGHMDTNFAVGKLKASCNTTQGAYTGSGNPGNDIIADYEGSGWYADVSSGKTYKIETTPDVYNALTNDGNNTNYTSRPYITFDTNHSKDELLKKVSGIVSGTASKTLADEPNIYNFRNAATHAQADNTSTPWVLDLSRRGAGTYYFTFTDAYSNYTNNGGPMKIKLNKNQIVVFNIPGKTVQLEQFEIDLGNGYKSSALQNKDADEYCQHVVWNLYEATTASNGGSVLGMVLAPNATYSVGGTSTGWLVANKVINGGEWHMVWQDMPETEGISTQFFAKKTVNNAAPAADEIFTFDLYSYDWKTKKYSSTPIQSVQNAGELITFKPINYDYNAVKNAGGDAVYSYKIEEKATTKNGYLIDQQKYVIHVKVRVNGNNLEIYEKNVYKDGGKTKIGNDYPQNGTLVRFNNTHYTCEENDTTSYTIRVKKTLKDKKTGKALNGYWPTSFNFTLTPYYSDPGTPVDEHMPVPNPNPKTVTISSGNDNVKDLLTINLNAKEVFEHVASQHSGWRDWMYHVNYNLSGGGWEEVWSTNYKYKITEQKVNNDGIEYEDNRDRYLKIWVNVSKLYKNGKIKYSFVTNQDTNSISYGMKVLPKYSVNDEVCVDWDNNPIEFVNQYEAEGKTKIYGKKILENHDLRAGDFTFVLKDKDGNVVDTKTNDASGNFEFKELTYTLDDLGDEKTKVFEYTVEEDTTKTRVQGVRALTGPIPVNVTVTNNGRRNTRGKYVLDVTNDYDSASKRAEFTNTYGASGEVEFYAKKINKSNKKELNDKTFTFVLKGKEGDSAVSEKIEGVKAGETKKFKKIEYALSKSVNSVGTHKYEIYEENDGQGGVVYDNRHYNIEVRVTDGGNGTLNKEVWAAYDNDELKKVETATAIAEFYNDYEVRSVEEPVDGTKTLHGKDLEANEFTFKLEAYDEATKAAVTSGAVVLPAGTEVKNTSDGAFSFGNIKFTQAGEDYKFKVSEIPGENSKYTYDGTYYVVTIPVKDVNGQLTVDKANKTIENQNGNTVTEISFENYYHGEGSVPLYARKNLTGRTVKNGEFTFTLESNDGHNGNQTVTNNGSTVAFDALQYTTDMLVDNEGNEVSEKKFTYTIRETVPADAKKPENIKDGYYTLNGVYYDKNAENGYDVTVTVTRKTDGSLTAVADRNASVSAAETEVEFDNLYKATGSFDLPGSKVIMGRKFVENDAFTVKLTMPNGETRTVDVDTAAGNTSGSWAFSNISFDQSNYTDFAGEYKIEEVDGGGVVVDGKPVRNDRTIYYANVVLTDNEKGTINHAIQYYTKDSSGTKTPVEAITFVNEYDAEGSVNMMIHKVFPGTLERGMFKFYLKDNATDTVIQERENGQGANEEEISPDTAIFADINYTLDQLTKKDDGTYEPRVFTYTIGEYEGNKEYIDYNTTNELYTVEVTVSNNGAGKLSTSKVYKNAKGEVVNEATAAITNDYHTYGSEVIYAKKILNGKTLKDGAFTFLLKGEDGITRTADVVASTGKATFDKIEFTEEDLDQNNPKFILNHATGEKGKYARYFTLREQIPEGAQKSVVTVDGKQRVIYKKDGYTYDGTIYSVVVTLKDNGEGHIDTDWVVYAEGDVAPDALKWYESLWSTVKSWFGADKTHQSALFTNDYESTGALKLKAKKSLVGLENKAGAFSFILSGKDEGEKFEYTVPTKAVITEDGKTEYVAEFPERVYTEEGEYTYTIKEFVPEGATKDEKTGLMMLNGVKYDNHEYEVKVSVKEKDKDKGNGKLVVTIKVDNTDAVLTETEATINNKTVDLYTAAPVTFTNTYDAEPVEVTLGGNKTLSGRDLEEGDEFSFKIEGEGGTTLPAGYDATPVAVTVINGSLGTFSFPAIRYELKDLADDTVAGGYAHDKEFKYLVTEVIPDDEHKMEGITYDPTLYHVVVKVTNANGKLTAKITSNDLEKDADQIASFNNKYNADGGITFEVLKKVFKPDGTPVTSTDKTFEFQLTGDGITTPYTTTAVNGAKGTFSELTYTLEQLGEKNSAGKYEKVFNYKVEEIIPDQNASDNAPTKGGYKYTDEYYKIKVTVTSNGKTDGGKLATSKEVTRVNRKTGAETPCGDIETFEFDNEYYAFGEIDIEGEKSVSEDMPADKQFHFALFDENDVQIGEPVTLNNGGFSFHIDYTQADIGTHKYSVKEVLLDGEKPDPTIIYDESVYDVTVVVADRLPADKEGTLRVSKTITKDDTESTFDKCYFSNTKVLPNSIIFTAKKTLTGKQLEDSMFTFTLKGDGQDQTVNNHGEKVVFEPIEYKLSDFAKGETEKTYNYTVKEEKTCTKPGGMSYIKTDYTAEVKVSVVDGKIVIDPVVRYDGSDIVITVNDGTNGGKVVSGIEFVNKYEDSVDVQFGAFKHLNGFKDGETPLGTYKFELKDMDSNKVIETKEVAPDKADEDKLFDFEKLTFTQADLQDEDGNYLTEVYRHFRIKEVIPTIEEGKDTNVTYATNTYSITVKLSFNAQGDMVAEVTSDGLAATLNKDGVYYLGGMGFTNTYAAKGSVILEGVKTIEGKDLEEKMYTFTLFDESGKNVIRVDDKGKIVATGGKEQIVQNAGTAFTFAPISYNETDLGEHTYIIRETLSEDGSEIDSTEFKAVVTVANGANGELAVSKKYYKKTVEEGREVWKLLGTGEKVSFKNTFEAEGEIELEGLKKMYNKPLKAGDFTFVIKDENGKVLTDKDGNAYTATCGASSLNNKDELLAQSAFKFAPIKYDQTVLKTGDGSYLSEITKYYTVEEQVTTKKGGVVYSQARYGVEVTIKLNKKDKKLEVSKIVKALVDDEGKAVVVVPEGGIRAFFENLLRDSATKSDDIVFTNRYDSKCLIDPPFLHKQIMGRKIERGEFEFSIVGAEPDKAAQKSSEKYKNGYSNVVRNGYAFDEKTGKDQPYYYDHEGNYHDLPEGEIFVGDIRYQYIDLDVDLDTGKASRTFEYIATEIPKKGDGVGYTPQKFKLTVTVYDNDDGTMSTDPEIKDMKWVPLTDYRLSDKQMKDTFLNTFNQEGSIDLVGTKKLNGRKLTEDDKFEFILTDDATGKSVTVNNTNLKGTNTPSAIVFKAKKDASDGPNVVVADFLNYRYGAFEEKPGQTPVNLIEVDETGEHTYTIVEKFFEDDGIKCDTSAFRIHVDVQPTIDGNGKPVVNAEGHGQLAVSVTRVEHIFSDNNVGKFEFAPGSYFEFVNTFKAEGKIDFPGKKYLKDQAGNDIVSPDALEDEYEFALYSYSDAARKHDKTLVDVVKTDKDGNFKLDVPKYTEEVMKNEKGEYVDTKTLYYRLIETKPANGTWTENNTIFESDGVIYDNTEYDIDVNIAFERDAQGYLTGKLLPVAEIKKADTGEAIKNISFTNIVKEYVSVEGQKHWIDKETDPSKRPDVLLRLYSSAVDNGKTEINRYTIKAPDTTYRFFTDAAGKKLPATDSKGRAITYTVKEDVIRGYLSEQVGYDFYNTQGDILIRKVDADTDSPLSGAVLAILDGTTEIERWTSGASAHVVEKALTPGKTYTLHEVSAPEGYGLAADVTFTVPTDGSSITVTMADPPIIGSVRLIKRDADTRAELAGAEFALYTESGARIYATGTTGSYSATSSTSNGVFVTDASGALTIADLPYGTYYFVETKAPEGYALSTERLGFTILRGGELVEVTFTDPKAVGSVRLSKVGTSGRALSGAVFELYAATPRTIGQAASSTIFTDAYYRYGTYRTNAAGELYVGDLPWDDYYFIEVEAPDGYEIATDVNGDQLVYTFTVSAASADATIDLGGIVNNPTTPPPPGPTPTPGVLGERVKKGGVVNGVLGVRAKPTSGVLGERIGPVTGDASNIILWLLLFTACVATIIATVVTGRKKKTAR